MSSAENHEETNLRELSVYHILSHSDFQNPGRQRVGSGRQACTRGMKEPSLGRV